MAIRKEGMLNMEQQSASNRVARIRLFPVATAGNPCREYVLSPCKKFFVREFVGL